MVWEAAISLVTADTTRFHLSGGWIGDCDQPFATASQPHILELHDFPRFLLTGARGARYQTQYRDYWIAQNETDEEWQRRYWTAGESAPLEQVSLERLHTDLIWYEWPNKFPITLHSLMSEWDNENVNITALDDSIMMRILLYESYSEHLRHEEHPALGVCPDARCRDPRYPLLRVEIEVETQTRVLHHLRGDSSPSRDRRGAGVARRGEGVLVPRVTVSPLDPESTKTLLAYRYSFTRRARRRVIPGTAATSSRGASPRALTEPKRRSSIRRRFGPMPGTRSIAEAVLLFERRLR